MNAPRRRPTIRRVRDWEPSGCLRAPRVPLDLVPRESMPTVPWLPAAHDEDEDEETATLARFIPIDSEVRELARDPEDTLAELREVQASLPDGDTALASLVAVYEERVARLAKERAHAAAIAAQAMTAQKDAHEKAEPKKRSAPRTTLSRARAELEPHVWKIVYSMICIGGLLELALTR